MELKDLKGVGPQTLKKLNTAGIESIEDLVTWYPRDYVLYEQAVSISGLSEEKSVTIYGYFKSKPTAKRFNGTVVASGTFYDDTGKVSVSWYHMPYITKSIPDGWMYLHGKAIKKKNTWNLYQPSILKPEQYEALLKSRIPIYPLKSGLTNKLLSGLIGQCLEEENLLKEYLPLSIRQRYELSEINYAVKMIHFPVDEHDMLLARKRLVFDEFFFFMLSVRELKAQKDKDPNCFVMDRDADYHKVKKSLPYSLTGAQERTLKEIKEDLVSGHVMNRLVQGDVGSGKTAIAFLSMILSAENGFQSTFMAPTEVLALQHYEAITKLMEEAKLPYRPLLLTGSMTAKQKREAVQKIKEHEVDFIIGTHALIQEKVEYRDLGLVITDEQHRFGVRQRGTFTEKAKEGRKPHVLVMSATPIPRTLALILYGDLDISVIDELPANRIPIKNCVVDQSFLPRAYQFIEKEVKKGRQAYVICSMVEESEMIEAENVLDYSRLITEKLPKDMTVGLLHGKMKPKEKNAVMADFAAGKIDVLVSTTVVEVGVNVPNATVMMIENAERFGLSQLHQLRGRVGRGREQSYCIFIDRSDKKRSERLKVLEKSNDGFFIASEDLRLRGPGDFYGERQNGALQFELADIYTDAPVLGFAKEAAEDVFGEHVIFNGEERKLFDEQMDRYRRKTKASDIPL